MGKRVGERVGESGPGEIGEEWGTQFKMDKVKDRDRAA